MTAVPIPAAGLPPARALRMLYVEDNRINAILFEETMRMRGGIELQVAADGAEALALARRWEPEVLVLDAHLPDMSGYELLARRRSSSITSAEHMKAGIPCSAGSSRRRARSS
jgi:CheY-like chemotaxis protein